MVTGTMKKNPHITFLLIFAIAIMMTFPVIGRCDGQTNFYHLGASKKNEAKYLVGTVVSASFADINLGTKSEIDVRNRRGAIINCIITDTTTMYDDKGNSITLDKVLKGQTVKIKYIITKSGIKESQIIKIIHA
jgi:hypothetical protein